jgi:hypothetical protein
MKPTIQSKLGLNDKDFAKCKFSVVSYARAEPLEDEAKLFDLDWQNFHQLGIDYFDKNASFTAPRYGFEKAIKIRS